MDREEYVERVLALAESVPPGRVTTYGAIAAAIGVGGARQVGRVMALYGGPVPWWRVVRADGSLPPSHGVEARERYRAEGTPLSGHGREATRVDIAAALWRPGGDPPEG